MKAKEAQVPVFSQEENHTEFLRSLRRGLVSAAAFIGGAIGIGVWDSTAPPSYIPWFTQAESFLRHILPTMVTNQLALTDGDQIYQATIMVASGLIAYFSLRDPKLSKLKDRITRNVWTLLMWVPNMILGDAVSASLHTNDSTRTITLVTPDPVQSGLWRNWVTAHSFMNPFMLWGDSPLPGLPNITNFYVLGAALAGAYLVTRFVGFKLYDKYQAKKLLRQSTMTDAA